MRQKVLSETVYRGYTIEHIQDETFHGPRPFHRAGYYKRHFWWIVELETDEPRLRDAKAHIDAEIGYDLPVQLQAGLNDDPNRRNDRSRDA